MEALKFTNNIKKDYVVVFFISIFVVFSGSIIAPVEQRFISSLTNDSVLMGFTFTLGTLSVSFLSLFLANLSKKFGKNKLIITGAALGIVYPLIYATSANIWQYMGGKLIFGFSGAALGPLLAAYLQEHLSRSDNQGKMLGYLYSAQSIAGSLGAIAGGIIADRFFLNTPFFVQSFFLAIPFLLTLKYFRGKEAINKNSQPVNYFFIVKYILSKPYLVYHLLLDIPYKMNWAVKVVLYPLVVISFINSNAVTGSVFATQGVVAMIVLLFAGNFVDKRSYMTGMNTAFLILGLTSLFMSLSTNLLFFWVFTGLFAAGEAISGPAKGVLEIKNIDNDHRAAVLALFSTVGFFIEALSPFLAGILLVWLRPQSVLLVYSLMIWFFFALATIILKMKLKKIPT